MLLCDMKACWNGLLLKLGKSRLSIGTVISEHLLEAKVFTPLLIHFMIAVVSHGHIIPPQPHTVMFQPPFSANTVKLRRSNSNIPHANKRKNWLRVHCRYNKHQRPRGVGGALTALSNGGAHSIFRIILTDMNNVEANRRF